MTLQRVTEAHHRGNNYIRVGNRVTLQRITITLEGVTETHYGG